MGMSFFGNPCSDPPQKSMTRSKWLKMAPHPLLMLMAVPLRRPSLRPVGRTRQCRWTKVSVALSDLLFTILVDTTPTDRAPASQDAGAAGSDEDSRDVDTDRKGRRDESERDRGRRDDDRGRRDGDRGRREGSGRGRHDDRGRFEDRRRRDSDRGRARDDDDEEDPLDAFMEGATCLRESLTRRCVAGGHQDPPAGCSPPAQECGAGHHGRL